MYIIHVHNWFNHAQTSEDLNASQILRTSDAGLVIGWEGVADVAGALVTAFKVAAQVVAAAVSVLTLVDVCRRQQHIVQTVTISVSGLVLYD